jgi:hypothetical protein
VLQPRLWNWRRHQHLLALLLALLHLTLLVAFLLASLLAFLLVSPKPPQPWLRSPGCSTRRGKAQGQG